ncbi:MAG: RlmE family RNA methyltransferase [Bdellovibrionota bacterium]
MNFNPRDRFFLKAKKENFAARSVYKLEEINSKYKIFRPKQTVLDLGASPGSWSQFASAKIGAQGRILGVDLSPMSVTLPNAVFIQADLRDLNLKQFFEEQQFIGQFDVVMSDMAPKTTGIRFTDQTRSFELCELALNVADEFLKPSGTFICKLFHSDEFTTLRDRIKKSYQKFEAIKPESTRKISKEIFLIGLSKK